MESPNLKIIRTFDENSMPDLDIVTLAALELFQENPISELNFPHSKNPLIVGSGNAITTAKILFKDSNPVFANESDYLDKLENIKEIDAVYIFSASGGKHAPIIAKAAKEDFNKKTYLITCTKNSQGEEIVGTENTIVTIKNREPYTYNTSTYLGWVLSKTKEDPKEIYNYILNEIKPKIPNNLLHYNGFLLITDDKDMTVNPLFEVKFIELFGRKIARDVKTTEELKHAITVVPSSTELCINFTNKTVDFVGDELKISLPENFSQGAVMAIGYYVIGQIQKQNQPYFKENIKNYIKRNSDGDFGKAISTIVE